MNKNKKIELAFLLIITVLGIFDMHLASKTAFLGEDEAGYIYSGEQLAKLILVPTLDPPFIPLLYSILFLIFGTSLSIAKMITAIFGFLTLVLVYLIGKKINIYVGIFSVAILLLIPIFTSMSLLAYVDVPTAFFSALLTYMAVNIDSKKKSIVLGSMIGISYFAKVSTFYIIMIFAFYSACLYIFKKDKQQFKLALLALGISIIVIMPYIVRNTLIFNYPHFIVIDMLVPTTSYAAGWIGPGSSITSPLLTLDYFISAFGWIPLVVGIFGSLYIFFDRRQNPKSIELSALLFLIFLAMFLTLYSLGKVIAEDRYLMIVFPQLALMGGYFLYKLKEKNKYLMILLVPIVIFAFYSSISIGLATSESVRFPQSYVQALEWVKSNTPKDASVFTTYSGSLRNYADRKDIWTQIVEFDKIMTTDNATYINSILKKYNVSYIVIWSGVVSESYIVPHANLAAVFSYQFVKTTLNANNSFSIVYQNQDNAVLKVL